MTDSKSSPAVSGDPTVASSEVGAAREAIRDLVARYNANGDTGRFARVRELFAVDAWMDIGDGTVRRGVDEIMTIFTGTATKVTADFVRHFTSTHQIDVQTSDRAVGRLYYAVLTQVGLDHWGRYVDEYARIDGRWLFASRTVSVDGWSSASVFPH